jgi:RNA polymerase sigma factor (sigma-70 family)
MPEPELKIQRVHLDQLAQWLEEWEYYEEHWTLVQILYTAASDLPMNSPEMNTVLKLEQDRIFLRRNRMRLKDDEAEDVRQNYCWKLCTSCGKYDPAQPVERWFNQILNNVIMRQRGRQADRFYPTVYQSPDQDARHGMPEPADPHDDLRDLIEGWEDDDNRQRLRHALACLSDGDRQILELSYITGMSASAIGALRGMTAGGVHAARNRCKRRLKEAIEGQPLTTLDDEGEPLGGECDE